MWLKRRHLEIDSTIIAALEPGGSVNRVKYASVTASAIAPRNSFTTMLELVGLISLGIVRKRHGKRARHRSCQSVAKPGTDKLSLTTSHYRKDTGPYRGEFRLPKAARLPEEQSKELLRGLNVLRRITLMACR